MRQKLFLFGWVLLGLQGCQWVKPTAAAQEVALVKPAHVENCEKLGSTTSTVKGKVGFVERKDQKVTDELVTLAKNEAASLKGDTIIAVGAPVDGRQKFDIYRCQ